VFTWSANGPGRATIVHLLHMFIPTCSVNLCKTESNEQCEQEEHVNYLCG